MPWPRQLWHVFAKDVRRQKWMLLLFAAHAFGAVLGLMTQRSNLFAVDHMVLESIMLYVAIPVTAAVLAALVVLEDSPTAANAWWPTIALNRGAVFGAKLLFVFGAIPLIMMSAVAVMHLSFDVPSADLLPLSVHGSRWIILAVTVAFPLAALLPDLRTFLIAAAAVIVAAMIGVGSVSSLLGTRIDLLLSLVSPIAIQSLAILSALLVLFLTWRVYRTRSRTWTLLGVLTVLITLKIADAVSTSPRTTFRRSARLESVQLAATLQPNTESGSGAPSFTWRVSLDGLPPELRGGLHMPPMRLAGSALCREVVMFGSSYEELQSPTPPFPGTPVRWRGSLPQLMQPADSVWTREWTPTSPIPADCSIVPRAELHVHEPRYVASIPLSQHATFTRDGYRVTVRSIQRVNVADDRSGNALVLATIAQVSSIPPQFRGVNASRPLTYALLHPVLREAIQLQVGVPSWSSDAGPLPRLDLQIILRRSEPVSVADSSGPGDNLWQHFGFADEARFDDWLRGARLAVFEWKLIGVIEADIEADTEAHTEDVVAATARHSRVVARAVESSR